MTLREGTSRSRRTVPWVAVQREELSEVRPIIYHLREVISRRTINGEDICYLQSMTSSGPTGEETGHTGRRLQE